MLGNNGETNQLASFYHRNLRGRMNNPSYWSACKVERESQAYLGKIGPDQLGDAWLSLMQFKTGDAAHRVLVSGQPVPAHA